MIRIVARRGNRLHAQENTREALISAYTAGADALTLDVQLTDDGKLVAAQDPSPEASVETFPELLDALPAGVPKLIELRHDPALDTDRRDELVEKAIDAILERRLLEDVIAYSRDPETLRVARERAPYLRICTYDWEREADEQVNLMEEYHADGLVVELDAIFGGGQLNEVGERLATLHSEREFRVGAVVYLNRDEPVFTEKEFKTVRKYSLVYGFATDSILEVAPFTRDAIPVVDEPFDGTETSTGPFVLGRANANEDAQVLQDGGVHVMLGEADEEPPPPDDPVQRELAELEERPWLTQRSSELCSGGGVGMVQGIDGDFAAEVDYEVSGAGPQTTLELAVANVDPPAMWDEDGFFAPLGTPPYAGIERPGEHGYRVNWNLGTGHDSSRHGEPAGTSAQAGRLRLERRGPWFSAYFKDEGAPDWVCAGVTRNDSLNPRVFLRCVGKRWLQAGADDAMEDEAAAPVRFVFRNLSVTRY